jgi:hypothetical protein
MDMMKNLFALFGNNDFTGFRAQRCAKSDLRPSMGESHYVFVFANSMARFATGENGYEIEMDGFGSAADGRAGTR